MSVPAHEAIAAAGARVVNREALPRELTFSTDTRSLLPGDVYLALRGATYDGHTFVRAAWDAGAAAFVVSDPSVVPDGAPALIVADTARAYLAFASVARSRTDAYVVAITGSAGKTTTKAFLAQILERVQKGRVVATAANENNEIGVAKLFVNLPPDTAYVVVEFGARHAGEIEPLARVARPDVAVLTNVGDAHLEIFGSQERLARTKWEIFSTGAVAVLNAADVTSRECAPSLASEITWFGVGTHALPSRLHADRIVCLEPAGDVPAEVCARIAPAEGSATHTLLVADIDTSCVRPPNVARYATDVRVAGDHNVWNVVAAAAAAIALGIDPASVALAICALTLPEGRYERIEFDGIALVYDAYNASTSGMLATLASFARERAARRIAVLGSMAELGTDAAEMHARVGTAAARSALDVLLVGGDFAADLARGARDGGLAAERIVPFASNAAALAWLRDNARPGDVVLLKASRRYKLEEIVAGLRSSHGFARDARAGDAHV